MMKIGQRKIGPGNPVYIVAEMSANHGQDFSQAVKLLEAAKEAGADAIKLQTYTPDTLTINCEAPYFASAAAPSGTARPFMPFTGKPTPPGSGSPGSRPWPKT
jgi:sialic acid synthase SpsE